MRLFTRFYVWTAAGLLAACSVLPKAETPDIYRLPATPLPHAQAPAAGWSLRINTPQAERMRSSACAPSLRCL